MKPIAYLGWAYGASGNLPEGKRYMNLALTMPSVTSEELLIRVQTLHLMGRRRDALRSAQMAIYFV